MARTATYQPTILLVGNTNVGKSTLFNGVTGAHQAMVNAPGTTVEMLAGTWKKLGARIIDLPGTYSLIPQSPDEEVVARIVAATHGEHIDLILAVLDGSSLTRSLYLLGQLGQTGHPVAALISMADVAKNNGVDIDAGALASTLGIPVMTFDARKSKQYETLDTFVANALESSPYLRGIEPDPSAPGFCEAAARRRAENNTAHQETRGTFWNKLPAVASVTWGKITAAKLNLNWILHANAAASALHHSIWTHSTAQRRTTIRTRKPNSSELRRSSHG